MKYILQETIHFDFFEQLELFVADGQNLLLSEDINLKELINEQIKKVEQYIREHIQPDSELILDLLVNWYDSSDNYHSETFGIKKVPEIEKEKNRLSKFIRSLKSTIKYLSVVDSFINPDDIQRVNGVTEKNDFILNKLNELFGDDYYSISTLLELNNVEFRSGETREIAEDLHRRGYIILRERWRESDDYVKISVKGASYAERKNRQKNNTKKYNDLDKKIDNIIEHLVKLGCGQEVIFNEIDELKELQYKLSKKTWSQLLKGKLLDLAIGEVINKETASSVYEYLTNCSFNLLK